MKTGGEEGEERGVVSGEAVRGGGTVIMSMGGADHGRERCGGLNGRG